MAIKLHLALAGIAVSGRHVCGEVFVSKGVGKPGRPNRTPPRVRAVSAGGPSCVHRLPLSEQAARPIARVPRMEAIP